MMIAEVKVNDYFAIYYRVGMRWNDRDAHFLLDQHNRIGGVMVSVLASIVVDHGFEPWSGQTKDYNIGI